LVIYLFKLISQCLGVGLVGSVTFACNSVSQSTYPVQEVISINLVIICTAFFGIIQTHLSLVSCKNILGLF